MKAKGGGPAYAHGDSGMSLRDYYAGQASMGWLSRPGYCSMEEIVSDSLAIADAMLAERDKAEPRPFPAIVRGESKR